MKRVRVAILSGTGEFISHNLALAEELGLPMASKFDAMDRHFDFYLHYDEKGLSLHSNLDQALGAVRVNFDNTALNRRSKDSLSHQNLIKAVGLKQKHKQKQKQKQKQKLNVLDAMTGLGSDAFLLACAGCRVTMLERNEIVFSLLRDGLFRGSKGLPETRAAVAEMMLLKGDFLEKNDELDNFDVLYIDPMFPSKRNTARSKKPMYLLQQLLGEAQEETDLLSLALSKARDRVVVKRAKRSPNYNNRKPDINFKGTSSRYDVYLVR